MQEPTGSFAASGKSEWLDRARQELKGKDPAELDWVLNERIRLSPHYTPEEVPEHPKLDLDPGWQPGSYVASGPANAMNAHAIEELQGGAEALLFSLYRQIDVEEMSQILAGIELPYISLHCALYFPDRDPAELFRDLIFYLRRRQYPLDQIQGSVDFDPLFDWSDPPLKPLIRLLRFVSKHMPGFRVLQVNGNAFNTGPARTDAELALTIAKGAEYLNMLRAEGVPPEIANHHMQFALSLGKSYYVDVAKLRALRILWANVLKGFGIKEITLPRLAAHSGLDSLTSDVNDNLLQLTTQALAAVSGGADLLFLLPADIATDKGATPFGRRMSRNIQQLLRLESDLAELTDPAAGSYYLDTLTSKLVECAWEQFLEIEAQGGFAKVEVI
ncbi:MAG: methylmalonyl-CoA mutase family protein [Bacteroidota bacterium]